MYNGSEKYKNEMLSQIRKKCNISATAYFVNYSIIRSGSGWRASSTDILPASLPYIIGINPPSEKYMTFEKDHTRADGTYKTLYENVAPDDGGQPQSNKIYFYVSDSASNSTGAFSGDYPTLTLQGGYEESEWDFSKGLSFVFYDDYYPTSMQVTLFDTSGNIVKELMQYPQGGMHYCDISYRDINKIEVEFRTTNIPFNRIWLRSVAPGRIYTFSEILSADYESSVDPLCYTIPTKKLNLSINNNDHVFDPENPKSMVRYLAENTIITADYNQEIDNEVYETVRIGKFLLQSWKIPTNSDQATFKCSCILDRISAYNNMRSQPNASNIGARVGAQMNFLRVVNWNTIGNDVLSGLEYNIDPRITAQNYSAGNPAPILSYPETIQTLCNYARATFYPDRDDVIQIRPYSDAPIDYYIDLGQMFETPTLEVDGDDINRAEVSIDRYYTNANASEEEVYNRSESSEIEYELTAQLSEPVDVSSIRFSPVLESGVYNGKNAYSIWVAWSRDPDGKNHMPSSIYAKKLGKTSEKKVITYSAGNKTIQLENPLLDGDDVKGYVDYIYNILKHKNVYTVSFRGDPALDAGDIIYIQTQFKERIPALILTNKWTFSGGSLKGEIVARGLDE